MRSVQVYCCSSQSDYIFRHGKCYSSRSFVIDSILCTSATRVAFASDIYYDSLLVLHIYYLSQVICCEKEFYLKEPSPELSLFLRNKADKLRSNGINCVFVWVLASGSLFYCNFPRLIIIIEVRRPNEMSRINTVYFFLSFVFS